MRAMTAAARSADLARLADGRQRHWSSADTGWEQASLAGVLAMSGGRPGAALLSFAAAVDLASEAFAPDDPRLAAALTNRARTLRALGDPAAETGFAAATTAWIRAQGWPQRLRVGDERLSPPQCRRLVDEGRRYSLALAARRPILMPCGLARWQAGRWQEPSPRRKLLAAVFLSTFRLAGDPAEDIVVADVASAHTRGSESNFEERKVASQ
ncbi:MAG: hypothetical protein U1E14_13920 [Geminicoccaceae bacterium]